MIIRMQRMYADNNGGKNNEKDNGKGKDNGKNSGKGKDTNKQDPKTENTNKQPKILTPEEAKRTGENQAADQFNKEQIEKAKQEKLRELRGENKSVWEKMKDTFKEERKKIFGDKKLDPKTVKNLKTAGWITLGTGAVAGASLGANALYKKNKQRKEEERIRKRILRDNNKH